MKFESFEDIIAWQKGRVLAVLVYESLRHSKDYNFRDQIETAAVSVTNNIAEGFERKSNKEFKHFLFISKGSCGEVRSMLYVAKDLGYIDEDSFSTIHALCIEISKILSGLIQTL